MPPTTAPPTPPPTTVPASSTVEASGYWILGEGSELYGFGGASDVVPDQVFELADDETAVAIVGHPAGVGGWVLTSAGRVISMGTAPHYGDLRNRDTALDPLLGSATSLSVSPDGSGYWIFTDMGEVVAFGGAHHLGDLPALGITPAGPIVDSVATTSGLGYYLLGDDGGVFAFGDAEFWGSMGDLELNAPAVGLVPDPDGEGYWFVGGDGGVFAFEAPYRGSVPGVLAPGTSLAQPVVGMVSYGDGYLMVALDGGVFNFASTPFLGSLGGTTPPSPIVAIATSFAAGG